MSKKDADQLVQDLRSHFRDTGSDLAVEKRGGHWHVVNAAGKSITAFASTPSDHRFRPNAIAMLRQRGIVPPGWRG